MRRGMDIRRPLKGIYKESMVRGERLENCVREKTQEYIYDNIWQ